MKNKKYFYSGILILLAATIFFFEGKVYFSEYAEQPLIYISLIIHNVLSTFLFSSNISTKDAAVWMKEIDSYKVLTFLYCLSMIIMQLFAASLILYTIWFSFRKRICKVFWFRREKVVVFGHNEYVDILLKDKFSEGAKKYVVHLVADMELSVKQESEYLKRGIFVHRIETRKIEADDVAKLAKEVGLKKAKHIILFEMKSLDNVTWFEYIQNGDIKHREDVHYYFFREGRGIEELILDPGNKAENAKAAKNEDSATEEKEPRKWDYSYIEVDEIRVSSLLSAEGGYLHTYNRSLPKNERTYDVHALLVGFDGLGQAMVGNIINMGVLSADNKIVIDVLDRNIEEKLGMYENRFGDGYVEFGENEIYLGGDKCDGELHIRFHELDLKQKAYRKKIEELAKNDWFTYVAVCLNDEREAMYCAMEAKEFLQEAMGNKAVFVPVVTRKGFTPDILQEIKKKRGSEYQGIVQMKEDEDILDMNHIFETERQAVCRKFNCLYNTIDIESTNGYFIDRALTAGKNPTKGKDDWELLAGYKRESNRKLYEHQIVKRWLVSEEKDPERRGFLYDMARLEHRRWNYFMAWCGWTYTDGKKDEKRQMSPYLMNWKRFEDKYPAICAYDLISLMILDEGVGET